MILFLTYPRCSTCRKAKAFLDEHEITYTERHVVDDPPTEDELREWIPKSNKELRKAFNTSGVVYREMGLSKKLKDTSDEDALKLLGSNGKLVKRPVLVTEGGVFFGFDAEKWSELLKIKN